MGSLNIYIQTNQSKTLVWKRTGEQGNKWNFGQVGHKNDSRSYKVTMTYKDVDEVIDQELVVGFNGN